MNREIMTNIGIWSDFQMSKAHIIAYALKYVNDTLFLDSDIIITDSINDIDMSKDLGISPQFITQKYINKTGYYNGGMLWTKNKYIPNDWLFFYKKIKIF